MQAHMDILVWYLILFASIVVIAIVARFVAYEILVSRHRWLPERAAQTANGLSISTACIGTLVLVVKAVLALFGN
jgi:putative copper export protein